jgi:hypothetical protein
MAMIPKRRAIILALTIGSLVGGAAGATILSAEPATHADSALKAPQPGSSAT